MMSARILAMTSHKGGTGRTTTTANLAYQLAERGRSVCVVDLDLASPTFGAVLQMRDTYAGAATGIHDLLPKENGAESNLPLSLTRDLCLSVRDHTTNGTVRNMLRAADTRFDLLPGKLGYEDALPQFDLMAPALDDILRELSDRYEVIFVDVRSGTDSPLYALADGKLPKTWVVFYRWTPQHLAGTQRLVVGELVDEFGQHDIVAIRTALVPPAYYTSRPDAGWFHQEHDNLRALQAQLGLDKFTKADVRREDVLLWKEGILSEHEYGAACAGVIGDYINVLEALGLL